ncbi:E3 ubiquitin-protein ligase TRIM71-like [Ostrea edulis]|uniref:E3 ubiquitin-protein ligase TRIM71-like n=1 Tax=Ostrea edulis TaxID=37623 RepID=UPI0024AEA23F|nr:E3 ubiquitin-protein ligase TRIM71-like [Ostrea edulis]XP_048762156.2 E3 ubiquitin-protein ligase TRIM71-like [Ostrea edulis]
MAAQFIITCGHCDNPTECFCNPCQTRLCTKCVTIHLQQQTEEGHEIVCSAKKKNKYTSQKCKTHADVECHVFCRTCDLPICSKCVTGKHKPHAMTDLEEKIEKLSHTLDQEQWELRYTIRPLYKKIIEQIRFRIFTVRKHYRSLSDVVGHCGVKWHQIVDEIITDLKNELMQMEIDQLKLLEREELMFEEIVGQIDTTISGNSDLSASKNRAKLLQYRSEIKSYRIVPPLTDFLPSEYEVKMPAKEKLRVHMGDLKRYEAFDLPGYRISMEPPQKISKCFIKQPMLISQIQTHFPADDQGNRIYDIVSASHGRLWATGFCRTMKFFNTGGRCIDSFTVGHKSSYIALIPDGVLAYSDQSDNTIKKIASDGTVQTLIELKDWVPKGLASSEWEDGQQILVCLHHKENHKVLRLNSKGNPEQEFLYPNEHHPLYIAVNRNRDICTTDHRQNSVAVIDKNGYPRFIYKGNPESGKCKSFQPISIATDSLCNILVTDWANHFIHVLSGDGVFLRYITLLQRVKEPRGLCVMGDGLLCIGECASGIIKIFRYLKI